MARRFALKKSPRRDSTLAVATGFAATLMQRSKNGRLDADVLCEYAARMPLQSWRPPSPAAFKLMAVARRLEALLSAGEPRDWR